MKEKSPLVSDHNSLAGQFYYTNDVETINITSESIPVEEGKLTEDSETNLSDGWNGTEGLSLKIPIEKQLLGTYKGTLEWTLEDVP
ncbi:hypothetical protein SDC9_127233 [bioreactor metagenome]|uniref:WxL domain-containing protein n=1 Tax=bioreactor metagenome TaxID=1076179 RepID=A0A645CST7_9ZZZZ